MKKITWTGKKKIDAVRITDTFWKELSEKAYPLSKGEMRISISLEPFVISKDKNKVLHKDITLVLSAVKKLTAEYFKNDILRKLISVDSLEEELIRNSENMPIMGVVRVDLFYGKHPKIIEINADFPDGLFMHDVSSQSIQKINGTDLKFDSNIRQFLELLKAHKVKLTDSIFIGHNKGRIFLDEFELTRLKLNSHGFQNVAIGAFEDLVFKKNAFFYKGKRVDVIRRGSELSKLRMIPGFLNKIILAEKNHTVKVINNFKMRLLGHKALLAALHDKNYVNLFSKDEIKAIHSLVPKTYKLEDADMKDVLSKKDMWVLKPSDLAEGDGVTIGTSVSKKRWAESLANATKKQSAWILQEKVEIPSGTFHTFSTKNKMGSYEAYYDFCPHIFLLAKRITFGNTLVRFSGSQILNVMKGGGLTYLFEKKK